MFSFQLEFNRSSEGQACRCVSNAPVPRSDAGQFFNPFADCPGFLKPSNLGATRFAMHVVLVVSAMFWVAFAVTLAVVILRH